MRVHEVGSCAVSMTAVRSGRSFSGTCHIKPLCPVEWAPRAWHSPGWCVACCLRAELCCPLFCSRQLRVYSRCCVVGECLRSALHGLAATYFTVCAVVGGSRRVCTHCWSSAHRRGGSRPQRCSCRVRWVAHLCDGEAGGWDGGLFPAHTHTISGGGGGPNPLACAPSRLWCFYASIAGFAAVGFLAGGVRKRQAQQRLRHFLQTLRSVPHPPQVPLAQVCCCMFCRPPAAGSPCGLSMSALRSRSVIALLMLQCLPPGAWSPSRSRGEPVFTGSWPSPPS